MTLSASISHLYARELSPERPSLDGQGVNPNLDGQPINPNLWKGQPINPNIGFDLKLVSGIRHVLHRATDPALVVPMLLASPAYGVARVSMLRGLLGGAAEAWWSRGLFAQLFSSSAAFVAETSTFTAASRGLTHLLKGPVAWDAASLAHEWVGSAMSLSLLKATGFFGRQFTTTWRGLGEVAPQFWTKADYRALFWSGQVSGYLGLAAAHRLEEQTGYRPIEPGRNLWLDTLGDHLALGLGAFGGRAALGPHFAALEHRLSSQIGILERYSDFLPWLRGEATMMAGALGAGGQMDMGIVRMSEAGDPGEPPRPGGSSRNEPLPPADTQESMVPTIPPEAPASERAAPETIRGVRRSMAETMDKSREVPRANINVDVDLHLWPEKTNAMTRLMQAMVYATQQVPKLNSWYQHGDKPTLDVKDAVDLGVAVDTPNGLVVATLRDIASLSGPEMRARLKELQEKIKKGEIQSSELTGNTITLSNIGSIGGRYADAIVVPPTVAIVAAGRTADQVVAYEGEPAVHRVMPLSLSFDHRAIDGAEATRFLEAMKTDLQQAGSAMIQRPKAEVRDTCSTTCAAKEAKVPAVEIKKSGTAEEGRDKIAPGDIAMEFPHIGEGVDKGELVAWLVKEGDRVTKGQDIAEAMTDKATVSIPSPVDGVVKSLKFQEGDMVEVGQVFIVLGTEASQSPQKKPSNGSPTRGAGRPAPEISTAVEPAVAKSAPTPGSMKHPRRELNLSPRSPLPDAEISPLPERIHTWPQNANRPRPQFEILQEGQESLEWIPFSREERKIAKEFLTDNSELSNEDRIHYVNFVLDRLPAYPGLLGAFVLPPGTRNLEAALRHFIDFYSDESPNGFVDVLRETHLVSEGHEAGDPLGHDLLIGMRHAKEDAVYLLDRLGQLNNVQDPEFRKMAAAKDPNRIAPKLRYDLNRLSEVQAKYPELTNDEIRFGYEHGVTQRIFTQLIFDLKRGEGKPPFVVSDSGHEIQGAAAALAFKHSVNREAFAISPHYRSGTLVGMWSRIQGSGNFFTQNFRQVFSKITDTWSKGRETMSHFRDRRFQILPGQSEVGRNLQKGAGFARALQQKGHKDGVVYAEIGDGTMALSDLQEAMVIANKMGYAGSKVPLIVGIVDNQMAISVEPSAGRAQEDLKSYFKGFGVEFFTCDGNDFLSVYETYREAVKYSREQQKPSVIWVQNLSRHNDHSSAAEFEFDYSQLDSLTHLASSLVELNLMEESNALRRNETLVRGGLFVNYRLGKIGEQAKQRLELRMGQVRQEADPTLEETRSDIRIEFPKIPEPKPEPRPTRVIINGALRAALQHQLEENPMTWVNGQDIAEKGGVMQATAGLWRKFPHHVTNSPLNEPAIMSSAVGFALQPGAVAIPEIQFGAYSPSGLHWMIYAGNLLWRTGGAYQINWNLRFPVEAGIVGAVYHSMSMEGKYAPIPGLNIICASTSFDAYGLNRSAFEHPSPKLLMEPIALYRKAVGPAFPGEPELTTKDEVDAFEKWVFNNRGIPDIPRDLRIPLGKAAIRREGKGLTLLTWGLAHYHSLNVMDEMAAKGIDVELIDARTLVPFDLETIANSVGKTGRLLVAHQDRVFGGLGVQMEREVRRALPNQRIHTEVLGMEDVPGVPQNPAMELAVMVTPEKILRAAEEMMGR